MLDLNSPPHVPNLKRQQQKSQQVYMSPNPILPRPYLQRETAFSEAAAASLDLQTPQLLSHILPLRIWVPSVPYSYPPRQQLINKSSPAASE